MVNVFGNLPNLDSNHLANMSRWHNPSCDIPDVFVNGDGLPNCRNCGRWPNLEELAKAQAALPLPAIVPPDDHDSQKTRNFWWPPTVPWSQPSGGTATSPTDDGADTPTRPELAAPSPIYSSCLRPDEFRLLVLHPADDDQMPVHVTLETYPNDDCPEYETVSYTWADEQGDASLCDPVYVGQYWDVLFQTRNCAALLRFLRPYRGLRTIWVDAICINQRDIHEREAQVAKMRLIYQSAMRTVVFLGEDAAGSTASRKHRRRRHGLGDLARNDLGHVLAHRYFRRVWVIQELVLSQTVVLPVGDTDYITGALDSEDGVLRGVVDSSWVQHVCDAPSFAATRIALCAPYDSPVTPMPQIRETRYTEFWG